MWLRNIYVLYDSCLNLCIYVYDSDVRILLFELYLCNVILYVKYKMKWKVKKLMCLFLLLLLIFWEIVMVFVKGNVFWFVNICIENEIFCFLLVWNSII